MNEIQMDAIRRHGAELTEGLLIVLMVALTAQCLEYAQNSPWKPLGTLRARLASGFTSGQLNAAEQAQVGIIRLSHEQVRIMRQRASNSSLDSIE